MNREPLLLAIAYPGDALVRPSATTRNNRFAALFDAIATRLVNYLPTVGIAAVD